MEFLDMSSRHEIDVNQVAELLEGRALANCLF